MLWGLLGYLARVAQVGPTKELAFSQGSTWSLQAFLPLSILVRAVILNQNMLPLNLENPTRCYVLFFMVDSATIHFLPCMDYPNTALTIRFVKYLLIWQVLEHLNGLFSTPESTLPYHTSSGLALSCSSSPISMSSRGPI